jgi:hypothetical protein
MFCLFDFDDDDKVEHGDDKRVVAVDNDSSE